MNDSKDMTLDPEVRAVGGPLGSLLGVEVSLFCDSWYVFGG